MRPTFENVLAEYRADRPQDALDLAEIAIREDHKRVQIIAMLVGNIHLKMGNREKAALSFVSAADAPGQHTAANLKKAMELFFDLEDWDGVAMIGPRTRVLNGFTAELSYKLALALHEIGRMSDASSLIEYLNLEDHCHLMFAVEHLQETGQFQKLASMTERLLESQPDNPVVQAAHLEALQRLDHNSKSIAAKIDTRGASDQMDLAETFASPNGQVSPNHKMPKLWELGMPGVAILGKSFISKFMEFNQERQSLAPHSMLDRE